MNTHSCFDLNSISEVGNKAIVKFTISEGYWETQNIEGELQDTFIRANIIKVSDVVFNYFPVPMIDIEYSLKEITKQYSILPLCF